MGGLGGGEGSGEGSGRFGGRPLILFFLLFSGGSVWRAKEKRSSFALGVSKQTFLEGNTFSSSFFLVGLRAKQKEQSSTWVSSV